MPTEQHHPHKSSIRPKALITLLLFLVVILLAVIVFLMLKPALPPPPAALPIVENRVNEIGLPAKSCTGVVKTFTFNAHRDINAIEVETTEGMVMKFDFRPHTANAVMRVAKQGSRVSIAYARHPNDEYIDYELIQIKNLDTHKDLILADLPPPPRLPPGEEPKQFHLIKPQIISDAYGSIAALRYKPYLFHFRPEQVDDIVALLKKSQEINLLAVSRDTTLGFVNADHDKVYLVLSITVNNQTFLLR